MFGRQPPGAGGGRAREAAGGGGYTRAGMRDLRYRCAACGNLTRFDVIARRRTRAFYHFTLGGEVTVEDEVPLEEEVERVVCRWCGSADQIEEVPRVGAEGGEDAG